MFYLFNTLFFKNKKVLSIFSEKNNCRKEYKKKNKTMSEKLKICFAVVVVVFVVVVVMVGVKLIKGERQKNKQIDYENCCLFFYVVCTVFV